MKTYDFDVDAMIAEGRSVMAEAMAGVDVCAVAAAFSGGDDSIVAAHFAMSQYPDAFVLSADTLIRLPQSVEHRIRVCDGFRWHLQMGKATAEGPPKKMRRDGHYVPFDEGLLPAGRWSPGATAYEEFCLNHGFPGRGKPQHARMYQRLKERVFRRTLKALGASAKKTGRRVVLVSGIRHDESAIRAGYRRAFAPGYFGDLWVNPFYWRTKADFAAYIEEFGLPRNPVKQRCGISGDCCCETFGTADGRAAYREISPPFWDYIMALEQKVRENGFPWGYGESPPQWWVNQQRDKKSGQRLLQFIEPDVNERFQPACVGCLNGRR